MHAVSRKNFWRQFFSILNGQEFLAANKEKVVDIFFAENQRM
jgi:hypothetical protein